MIDQSDVSKGFTHFLVSSTFLQAFILKFTPIKNAPINPPIIPINIAAKIFWAELT